MACPQRRRTQTPLRCGNSVPISDRCARFSDVVTRRASIFDRIDTNPDRDYLLNFIDTIPITRNTPLQVLKNVPPGTIVQIFDFPDKDKRCFAPQNTRPKQTCSPIIEREMEFAEQSDKDKRCFAPQNTRPKQTCSPIIEREMKSAEQSAERFVKSTIASHKVVIFSTTTCPYCKMAKEKFQNLKQKFTAIELNQRDDADELLDVLGEITGGGRTVPRVFVNGRFIGGGTEVTEMYENGSLRALLAK